MRVTILTLSLLILNTSVQALPMTYNAGSLEKRTTITTTATPTPILCARSYTSVAGDTCTSIGGKFGLSSDAIWVANSFLDCKNIWVGTPICILPGGSTCTQTIYSTAGATCDSIGSQYGVSGGQIKIWNDFLDCKNIWTDTPVCVRH